VRTSYDRSAKGRVVTIRILNEKFRAAKYSDQRVEFNEKPCLFEAFSDGCVRRLFVRIDGASEKGPAIHFGISAQ
jgi:hypothetical protein